MGNKLVACRSVEVMEPLQGRAEVKTPSAPPFPKILMGFMGAQGLPRGLPSKPSLKLQFLTKATEIRRSWSASKVSLTAARPQEMGMKGAPGQRAVPDTTTPADLSVTNICMVLVA